MILILFLDVIVLAWLVGWAWRKGFEETLPGAAFLLLLLPNQAQIPLPGLFDLTTHRLVVIVLLGLWWFSRLGVAAVAAAKPVPMKGLMVALSAWMLLSSATSVVPLVSVKATLSQVLDFFLIYVLYFKGITRAATLDRILYGMVLALLVSAGLGAVEAYSGWSVLSLFPAQASRFSDLAGVVNDRGLRVQSTFGHSILFGGALAMTLPAAFYLLGQARTPGRRVLLWCALLLMFLCAYKTGSRGPWLAVGLVLAMLLAGGTPSIRRAIAVLLLLAAVVWIVRPGVGGSILNLYAATRDPSSPEGQSYQWRWMLYGLARRELARSPGRALWGYGPESFYFLNLTAPFVVEGEERTVPVLSCDSAVVEILMDEGYVGLFLIGCLFAHTALTGFRVYAARDRQARLLPLVLLLAVGVFCFMMTNVEIYGWGQQNYMLWIVMAMIQALPGLPTAAPGGRELQPSSAPPSPLAVSWPRPASSAVPHTW